MTSTAPLDHAPTQEDAATECKHHGMMGQFGHPTGSMGAFIGHVMAFKNREINMAAAHALDIQAQDKILEIGFGPGATIGLMAGKATQGHVTGIDLSQVMVDQASKRNRKHIEEGRVELHQGDVSELPFQDESFDKAIAINSFHHWPNPIENLTEIRRTLRQGGTLLLALRMKHPTRTKMVSPGYTQDQIDEVQQQLKSAGFKSQQIQLHQTTRPLTCLLAQK